MLKNTIALVAVIFIFFSCESKKNKKFVQVAATKSNITFSNTITEDEAINVIDFQYCYNGGGVGIGDFNNDQLPDIFFTGNQVSSQLYLNKGALVFEDITTIAGVATSAWITGVSIIDINADGWDDIYLNVGGANCTNDCNNLLFIHKGLNKEGIPVFEEKALAYGLNDGNYSQQTVFFDHDQDGDLDAYIVHNGNVTTDKNTPVPKRYMPAHLKDYLMQNDFDERLGHPVFTNVSKDVGITHQGFGLGVGINDFNNDGKVDVYVSNDFVTEDLLYLNAQSDTTSYFNEVSKSFLGHETYNAMGVDISDVNNDALSDIVVLDMFPEDYQRQKKMIGAMNYDRYRLAQRNNYASQYMRNTLQLNNGSIDGQLLQASEVGYLSNIYSTDWSWSPLAQDYDNDGDKDLYVTNGYAKDITDLDFINYTQKNNLFGNDQTRSKKLNEFLSKVPEVRLNNYFFENTGESTFKDVSTSWFDELPSLSNGVASADLDADGDLDLVVNNINETAFIIENKTNDNPKNHFLQIVLKGNSQNKTGIGAKVNLFSNGQQQHHFQSVVRGYLSSIDPIVHFGLKANHIDSVQVIWPTKKVSVLKDLAANQRIVIQESEAVEYSVKIQKKERLFSIIPPMLPYKHNANNSNDYVNQRLLLRQYSSSGPCIAVGNIDQEKGDELYIGGSKGKPGHIWRLDAEGVYEKAQVLDSLYEDVDAQFIDLDGDSDLDLYVASGGNELKEGDNTYHDRIYINDGSGTFTRSTNQLSTAESSSCVRAADIDNDGDIDLFVGARISPMQYPKSPKNKIFINEKGKFIENTPKAIRDLGMVTDAVWQDIDNDGWKDLIALGEWMPITVFKNQEGSLQHLDAKFADNAGNQIRTEGWWNCIAAGDFDNDGDVDFIAGNQGLNTFYKANQKAPIHLYKGDFDKNGSVDPIIAQYFDTADGQQLMPVHSRDDIMLQLSSLKKEFLSYDEFSKATFEELLKIQDLNEETLTAYFFESCYIENKGNENFTITPLPKMCQTAPVQDILIKDFDADELLDVLLVGNDYSSEAQYGRYDALTGVFLKGQKEGAFQPMPSKESGFYVAGDVRNIRKIETKTNEEYILTIPKNSIPTVFRVNENLNK